MYTHKGIPTKSSYPFFKQIPIAKTLKNSKKLII
jgi:hypothetical protein